MRWLAGFAALSTASGGALVAYAYLGAFHPHGFENVMWLLGGAALAVVGLVAAAMAFLIYTLPRS